MPLWLVLAYQVFKSKLDKVTVSGTCTYNGTTYNLSQTLMPLGAGSVAPVS
jgi:hypothetical protein